MYTLQVSPGLSIQLYNSIEEFPVYAELEARQYATIGSALAFSDEQLEEKEGRIAFLQSLDKPVEAALEQSNYNLSKRLMKTGYRAVELEWACYIASVNGEAVQGISEELLTARVAMLKKGGLASEQIENSLCIVKEAMTEEMAVHYPNRLEKGRQLNVLARYKAYGLALADYYRWPTEPYRNALNRAAVSLVSVQPIPSFGRDSSNVLAQIKQAQLHSYTVLTECGVAEPKALTLYEYYGWIGILEKRYEAQKAALNPPSHAPKRQ